MEATLEQSFFGPAANQKDLTPYQRALKKARQLLVGRGWNYLSSVYITAFDAASDEINTEDSRRKVGMTFEVSGHYAAIRLAERSHRLAEPEEIAQYLADRRKREEDLARIENDKPENKLRGAMADALRVAVDRGAPPAQAQPAAPIHNPESPSSQRRAAREQQPL